MSGTLHVNSRALAVALALALTLAVRAAPPSKSARIEVLAREVAPGEAVRIRVHFPQPVSSVAGTFLARALSFLPDETSGVPTAARTWSAWSLVPLDEKAGRGSVDVAGHPSAGADLRASRSVAVHAKAFPTQRLTVESQYVTPPKETQERIERERKELATVYALRTAVDFVLAPFTLPVPGEPTSTFGARRIFNGEPRDPHPGLDLKAAEGTPVLAAGPGWVRVARDLYFSGGTVILDHGGGLFTVYAHLSRWDVAEGQEVQQGSVLGASGATGRVTGPHLHWGAKIGELPFDPRALLDPVLFAKTGGS